MRNGKLFVFALFISILGACATTGSVSSKTSLTSLAHPRPDRFWENGQAAVQVIQVFDQIVIDPETGEAVKDPDTGEIKRETIATIGSGAVLDVNGIILTNSHAVDATPFEPEGTPPHKIDSLLVCKVIRGKADPDCDDATIVFVNQEHDFALLKTKTKFDHAVVFGPDSELMPGDEVYYWGNVNLAPLSPLFGRYVNRLEYPYHEDIPLSVRGKIRTLKLPLLLIDIRTGPGSSGGPMFDEMGRCIGIMSGSPTGSGPTFGVFIPSSVMIPEIKKNWPKEL